MAINYRSSHRSKKNIENTLICGTIQISYRNSRVAIAALDKHFLNSKKYRMVIYEITVKVSQANFNKLACYIHLTRYGSIEIIYLIGIATVKEELIKSVDIIISITVHEIDSLR